MKKGINAKGILPESGISKVGSQESSLESHVRKQPYGLKVLGF